MTDRKGLKGMCSEGLRVDVREWLRVKTILTRQPVDENVLAERSERN